MGFWKTTKKVIGHAIDIRVDRWSDFSRLKRIALFFWGKGRALFAPETANNHESFEEAVQRLALTPELLDKQARRYHLLTFFFSFLGVILLTYGVVISYLGNWMGGCISFSLALYAFSLAFRAWFWHFQITRRKLGCSVQEWSQSFPLFFKRIKQQ